VSSEGKPFKVSEEAARLSTVLADMIDNGCAGGNIPLPNVTARALVTVIKYCDKHAAAAAAKPDSDHCAAEGSSTTTSVTAASEKTLAEWDSKLVDKLTLDALYDLLLASNFLDIKGLLGAASQKVADIIKSKTPAQVRTIFGITNDFTPEEEEEEVRKENPWAFEDEEP
jgi:S-phase kinase-associated protein 1